MAVFNPQGVNLEPFYANMQRSIERRGEAEARGASSKYAMINAGAETVSKIGNYLLEKEINSRYEDRNKIKIPVETLTPMFMDSGMTYNQSIDLAKKVNELGIDPESGMKIVQEKFMQAKKHKSIESYRNSLSPEEQKKFDASMALDEEGTGAAMARQQFSIQKPGQKIAISDKTSSTGARWGLITPDGIKPTEYEAPKESLGARGNQYRLDPMTGLVVPVSEISAPEPLGKSGMVENRKQLNPVQRKTLNEAESKFRTDTKELRDQMNVANEIATYTKENPRAGLGPIQRQLARFFGEVRVTDQDAQAFSGSKDIYTQFIDLKQKYTTGQLSDVTAKDLNFLVELSRKVKVGRLEEMTNNAVERVREDIPNADDNFLKKNIAGTILSDLPKNKTAEQRYDELKKQKLSDDEIYKKLAEEGF